MPERSDGGRGWDSSAVERFHGKEEVVSSSLTPSSWPKKRNKNY